MLPAMLVMVSSQLAPSLSAKTWPLKSRTWQGGHLVASYLLSSKSKFEFVFKAKHWPAIAPAYWIVRRITYFETNAYCAKINFLPTIFLK
jgi:hypothetical protein